MANEQLSMAGGGEVQETAKLKAGVQCAPLILSWLQVTEKPAQMGFIKKPLAYLAEKFLAELTLGHGNLPSPPL